MHDEVRDIAMNENFSGIEPEYLVGGYAAVRATYPQVSRRLLARETREEFRILRLALSCPGAVVGE
jgi:hypothetical protein